MNNLSRILLLSACFILLPGFFPDPSNTAGAAETCSAHRTAWSDSIEASVELPTLVKRKPATVEFVVTDLIPHKPFTGGAIKLGLSSPSGDTIRVEAHGAGKPGRFKGSIVPMQSGPHKLMLEVMTGSGPQHLDLGEAPVAESPAPTAPAHDSHAEPEAGVIAFSQEQQWAVEFQVRPPVKRGLTPKTVVPGELMPVSNAECIVTTPLAGVVSHEFPIPYLGQHVGKGEVLAHIEPPLQQEGGADQLTVSLAEAESRVLLAQKEFDRAKRLYEAKAAPRKRLEEAEIMLKVAKTAVAPLRKSVGQLQKGACHHVIVKAPISGTVIEIAAPNGSNVQPGQALLRIINPDVLWLKANVPSALLGHSERFSQAYFTVTGFDREFRPSRLVTVSDLVDPKTRTIPVLFEIPNPEHALKVGLFVNVFLSHGEEGAPTLTLPETAIFEDESRFFVYVQIAGGEFRRKEVVLGSKDGGYVQIREGIAETDRVVTRGGYYVKQASQMSGKPADDGHGH